MKLSMVTKLALEVAAVLVPAAIAIVGIYVQYDLVGRGDAPPKLVSIDESSTINPLASLALYDVEGVFTFRGQAVEELRIASARIRNEGEAPIRPSDFYQPLSVSVGKPWRVISVESKESDSTIPLEWEKRSEQVYEADPFLFNPGDSARIVAYLTRGASGDEAEDEPRVSYGTRILNLSRITPRERASLDDYNMGGVFVFLTSDSLTAWFVFFSLYFLVYLHLGMRAGFLKTIDAESTPYLVGLGLLAACAGEATSSMLFPHLWLKVLSAGGNNSVNIIILVVHSALVVWLARAAHGAKTRGSVAKAT